MLELWGWPRLVTLRAVLLVAAPLLAGSCVAAVIPFVAPADGPVPFRRDRLPLDVDTMMSLSEQLGSLANGLGGEDAVKRRTVAQMLALALALQPANPEPRRILDKFAHGIQKAWGEQSRLADTGAAVWKIREWLESPLAGADGHALADCLGDVMASADPRHPCADALRQTSERGAWAGWVQPLQAFHQTEEVVVKNITPDKPAVPGPAPVRKPDGPILLDKAVVHTPLWTYDKATKAIVLRSVPIRMQAKMKEGYARAEPMSCGLEFSGSVSSYNPQAFRFSSANLVKALDKERGSLPNGVAVGLVCGDNVDYLADRNRNAVSGAAAVLMSAAISGNEPSATIIGEVQADGSFKLPPRFWEKLRALSDGPGGRLVLPVEAETYLPFILAVEDPGFFFKYEVCLAANLKELLARSAKTPEPELAQISARFLEVSAKLGNKPAAEHAANRFVRQRLEDISKGASYHASSRLLVIQGSGKRPSLLPRNILACELRKAIKPMEWIPKYPIYGTYDKSSGSTSYARPPDYKSLIATNDICIKELTRLGRYVEMRDRELLVQLRELVGTITGLARATQKRADIYTGQVPYRDAFSELTRAYQAASDKLNLTAIDESWR